MILLNYNHSVLEVMKNAIDWISRHYGAWTGEPAAIMRASVETVGTVRAHLRSTLVFSRVFALQQPELVIGRASRRFQPEGILTEEPTRCL